MVLLSIGWGTILEPREQSCKLGGRNVRMRQLVVNAAATVNEVGGGSLKSVSSLTLLQVTTKYYNWTNTEYFGFVHRLFVLYQKRLAVYHWVEFIAYIALIDMEYCPGSPYLSSTKGPTL